jgi:endonuclease I
MITMYEQLSLVNTVPEPEEMGRFDALVEWHFLDLPDEFEINRNNIIASYQGNRNPFIDYPLF